MHPEPEKFFLGPDTPPIELKALHPEMVHMFRLWQVFLNNVQPLVKIFHAPTVQQIIIDASADLDNVPKHIEALMFTMYLLAVTSMQPEDCERLLSEPRDKLLTRFSHAAQQALINARFMKSLNLITLQAYTLYAVSVTFITCCQPKCSITVSDSLRNTGFPSVHILYHFPTSSPKLLALRISANL